MVSFISEPKYLRLHLACNFPEDSSCLCKSEFVLNSDGINCTQTINEKFTHVFCLLILIRERRLRKKEASTVKTTQTESKMEVKCSLNYNAFL